MKFLTSLIVISLLTTPALADSWPSQENAELSALLDAAQSEPPLLIGGVSNLEGDFVKAFERDTGLDVDFSLVAGAEGLKRFIGEVQSEKPVIDVYITGGYATALVRLSDRLMNISEGLVLEEVVAGENWKQGEIPFADTATKSFLPSPGLYKSGLVLINTNLVDPEEIRSWDDLLAPKFNKSVLMFTPERPSAGQTFIAHMRDQLGEETAEKFLKDQAVLVSDYRQLTDAVAKGSAPVSVTALSVHIEKYLAQGVDHLKVITLEDVKPYAVGGFSVMAAPKHPNSPNAVQVFANWYLSKAGQQAYSNALRTPSQRTDVTQVTWPDYIELPDTGYVNTYDISWIKDVRMPTAEWIKTLELD